MKMSFKDECGRLCDKVSCTVHVHKSPNAENKRQTFVNTKILHIVYTAVKPGIKGLSFIMGKWFLTDNSATVGRILMIFFGRPP